MIHEIWLLFSTNTCICSVVLGVLWELALNLYACMHAAQYIDKNMQLLNKMTRILRKEELKKALIISSGWLYIDQI